MGILLGTWNLLCRTALAFMPSLARPADDWAAGVLEPAELRLYLRMDPRDRQHCVQVARRLLKLDPAAGRELLAAALLHDAGKALLPYNAWHRVRVHLEAPAGLPVEPLLEGLQGARQLREHHELLGARLLREEGGSEAVATLIERLADPGRLQDGRLRLLRMADDAT